MSDISKLATRYPQKRVLITGATSGLGEALALRFAEAGFRVAVAGRNPQKVARVVEAVEAAGGLGLAVQLEVTRPAEFETAAELVEQSWGGLDVVFNNAGKASAGPLLEFSQEDWEDVLSTDLWSVIHGCRQFAPLLRASGGGHLVNVASAAGLVCPPETAAYNVAKAGVVAISETLRVEMAVDKIDVTVCCPAVFKSSLLEHTGDFHGVTADGLRDSMEHSTYSSDDIAASLIRHMARRRLYSVPMHDAQVTWRLKGWMPEVFRNLLLYLYRHKRWIFKPAS
jgi:NAD(P)-dependent dehydrogenase (short-subunit alcohol dehydrogenase family)